MGFTEFTGQAILNQNVTGSDTTDTTTSSSLRNGGVVGVDDEGGVGGSGFKRLPDQEIMDGMEDIYFQDGVNCEQYELEVS